MKSDVIIQQLHIKVSSGDRSYMPQHVIISAGCDFSDLHEIKDVRIPRYTGFTLSILISAPSLGVYYCQQFTMSVCSSVTPLQIAFFCFSMESSHFLAISSHDPLYKTLFFDF